MTLTEAVQSGKPFRRPQWIGYLSLEKVENFCFSAQDLLARDYYLEERQVIITEVQFNEAWRRAETNEPAGQWLKQFKSILKKELGL